MGRKKGYVMPHDQPDDFDPENPYKDPVAAHEMREYLIQERWIGIEKAKILRERLKWCYRVEGVNHLHKCRHLVKQYLDATRDVGWGKDNRLHAIYGPKTEEAPAE
ncbi:NADH dehydrogenase [ubiquinone] 1 beta subcomplex subunit 10-B-like [Andrographis paniculata]|uniref:NADH dehydrogenase [ubiquinone] 1 beta subcomplex subunit 10-B-like n=1 Tax=Andrographis paniculata TaxID=175694 RepID=UPI0021E7A23C|nr:NADH dehydrogenase [ubiquinone] 1 beta subcomplex subunit 10-B-like [Andrographis paniculata]